MLQIFKTINGKITEVETIEKDTWINLVSPTKEEMELVGTSLHIEEDFLFAALDKEEISRVELDDETGHALITLDIPVMESHDELLFYHTIPIGIIETADNVVTVSVQSTKLLEDFAGGVVKYVFTNLRSRFIFQLMYLVATRFLVYLRQINRMTNQIEKEVHKSMKNKELFQLMDLEKSLVFFSTSLRANQLVMEKLQRGRILQLYEDDQDLLEDIIIEFDQAIEMATMYSNILSSTMDAFASIINNNLNNVMKKLTIVTILMSIPTMISSFYGMNVKGLPMANFLPVMGLIIVITSMVALVLYKLRMFS